MSEANKLIVYQSDDGAIALQGDLQNETMWASQKEMAQLFHVTPQNITTHIKQVFKDGELEEAATCKESLQVRQEGKRQVKRKLKVYNLDVMIAVGYHVNSVVGTSFRKWATNLMHKALKQHITQGYTINPIQRLVIPAKAGIHCVRRLFRQLDSRLRGNDYRAFCVIAESDPTSKQRMIGLVILLLTGRTSHA